MRRRVLWLAIGFWLGIILTDAIVKGGPVEAPRMIILNDPEDVFTPEQEMVLRQIIDQMNDINLSSFEGLRTHTH